VLTNAVIVLLHLHGYIPLTLARTPPAFACTTVVIVVVGQAQHASYTDGRVGYALRATLSGLFITEWVTLVAQHEGREEWTLFTTSFFLVRIGSCYRHPTGCRRRYSDNTQGGGTCCTARTARTATLGSSRRVSLHALVTERVDHPPEKAVKSS
jgi:hypothetical protein